MSAGVALGGANWIIRSSFQKLVYMSHSGMTVASNASMSRHYHAQNMEIESIKNADVLVIAPAAFQICSVRSTDYSAQLKKFCEVLLQVTQVSGGHVIVPCRPTPHVLDLFGLIALYFSSTVEAMSGSKINFPTILFVSQESKSLVATAGSYPPLCLPVHLFRKLTFFEQKDIDTEWLPSERQERSYKPDEPFFSNELISAGRLRLFSSIHEDGFRSALSTAITATAIGSSASVSPLIIFVGQNVVQSGEALHLVSFFKQDPRSAVVVTGTKKRT